MNDLKHIGDVTNGAEQSIETEMPYVATVKLRGVADFLFHRWNIEAIEAKAKAEKNSDTKKTDNLESYVYRCDDGQLGIPGEYLRGAIILAAKFKQDPRRPRKSAMDLFKAGVVSLSPVAPLGVKVWDYEDRRRAVVERQGITRVRPAMRIGWEIEVRLLVTLPEYIGRDFLLDVINMAGRIGGLGDFRPTYGRFSVVKFGVCTA